VFLANTIDSQQNSSKPQSVWLQPRVAIAHNLLTPSECEELIAFAEPRIEHEIHSAGMVVGRTSKHTTLLEPGAERHPVSRKLLQRVAELHAVPESFVEPLQVVRYRPGEAFCVHHDVLEARSIGRDSHQRHLVLSCLVLVLSLCLSWFAVPADD